MDILELRKALATRAKQTKEKNKHIVMRMWFSWFISKFQNDRGTIPPNIGDNILITENLYVTKNGLSAIVATREFSEDTYVGFSSDIINYVKSRVSDVRIDVTIKNKPHWINTYNQSMQYKKQVWEHQLTDVLTTERQARRAARQLMTLDVARSSEPMYLSRVAVTIRAEDGAALNRGIEAVSTYLEQCAMYKVIRSDILSHLEYLALISNTMTQAVRDIQPCVTSLRVISEMFPQSQGINDSEGVLHGIASDNNGPYSIDFRQSANAKHAYVEAKSGFGKTYLLFGILLDAFASLYNLCLMDIKGTELGELTRACNGIVLSMRQESNTYINCFRMVASDIGDTDAARYFGRQYALAKSRMLIMCDFKPEMLTAGRALIDEFLEGLYLTMGVNQDNLNTWERTDILTPHDVYNQFEKYASREMRDKYGDVLEVALSNLRTYMSREGAYGYIHEKAYTYQEILDTRVLCFDFGIAEESSAAVDPIILKLKLMDMEVINDAFVAYKKKKKEWTFKLLEESQICSDYLLEIYAKEMTLRRASNQVTYLLGNSVTALKNNPIAQPILDSINILILGNMVQSSQEYFIKEYNLSDADAEKLSMLGRDPALLNNFLVINMMKAKATTAIIKAHVPDRVGRGRIFKGVDTITPDK